MADLVTRYDEEVSKLLNVVGLDAEAGLHSSWAPNTSFEGEAPDVAAKYRLTGRAISFLFRLAPTALCESLARNRVKNMNKPLPHWFFRVFSGVIDPKA